MTNEGTYDFYDSQLKRIVDVNSSGAVSLGFSPSFTSADCTGTTYAANAVNNLTLYKGATTTAGQYAYYVVVNSNVKSTQQTIHSQISGHTCVTDGADGLPETLDTWQMTPVSINFTDPIAMPIHF